MDPVKTITSTDDGKTFEVPDSRIGSAADARSIVATLVQAETTRSGRRAKINGLLNGNRPWSQQFLINKGRGDNANFSQREAEGFVAAAKTPYYDLFREVDRYAQFTLDYGDDQTRQQEWSDKIGARYHYLLDDWDGLEMAIQRSQYQMVLHGAGPMVWTNDKSWRSESRMAGQILVPDDASADVEEWETAAIPRSLLPSDLWQQIQKVQAAGTSKWNVDAVKRAIMNATPDSMQKLGGRSWEYYEGEIRKGSAGFDNKSKRIAIVDLFQKEFDGSVSHFIVLQSESVNQPEQSVADEAKPTDEKVGFLYRNIGRFECFSQIVQGFLYDVGPDGQWHSVKGAGPKILDFCSVSDRLNCRMIDGAMAASGLIVKAQDANALQESAITPIAHGVALGPKWDLQQNRIGDNLQSPLLVKRHQEDTLSKNTGQYRASYAGDKHAPTLGQEQLALSQQAVLNKGDVNRYYRSLDRWHRETFRRVLAMGASLYESRKGKAPETEPDNEKSSLSPEKQAALDFYRGCINDGVPPEALEFENFCRIKATRSVGYGSQQMRLMIGEKLISLLPTMDERSRNAALRMNASALGGQPLADILYPRYDQPQLNDDHMALATLENNALRAPGGQVMWTPKQDNVIHFEKHFEDVAGHAQQVQQGGDSPENLMVHLEQAGPHLHEHLFAMMGDPTRKAQLEQMQKQWLGLSKLADQLKQQLEAKAQAEAANQPAQAPDPELIAALAKVHGELAIKEKKAMGDLQLKAQKQAAQLHLNDLKAAHGIRLDTVTAAATARPPQMAAA